MEHIGRWEWPGACSGAIPSESPSLSKDRSLIPLHFPHFHSPYYILLQYINYSYYKMRTVGFVEAMGRE